MHKQNAAKVAKALEPIRPSAELLAKTEALMRAAPQPTPIRKPRVMRLLATAACLVLVGTAALTAFLRTLPSDLTGTPGASLSLFATESTVGRNAVPMPIAQRPQMTTAELTTRARNAHGVTAAALAAQAVCEDVTVYAPTAENADMAYAVFCTLRLQAIDFVENAPDKLERKDRITAVIVCYDNAALQTILATLDDSGEASYKLWLSTAADGNLYAENGTDVLAHSAWMLHALTPADTAE